MNRAFHSTSICILALLIISCSKSELRESRYPNGQLESSGSVIQDDDDNYRRSGRWTYWWDDGQKKGEGEYRNGKLTGDLGATGMPRDGRIGRWTFWHQNGTKSGEVDFENGVEHGQVLRWYDDGQKERECDYKNGVLHGTWRGWLPNGEFAGEFVFFEGEFAELAAESITLLILEVDSSDLARKDIAKVRNSARRNLEQFTMENEGKGLVYGFVGDRIAILVGEGRERVMEYAMRETDGRLFITEERQLNWLARGAVPKRGEFIEFRASSEPGLDLLNSLQKRLSGLGDFTLFLDGGSSLILFIAAEDTESIWPTIVRVLGSEGLELRREGHWTRVSPLFR